MPLPGKDAPQESRGPAEFPGGRGTYVVLLPCTLLGEPGSHRYFHFAFQTGAYVLRDFRGGVEKVIRSIPGRSDLDIWNAATRRVPVVGELRRSVNDLAFWSRAIQEFDQGRR